MNEDKIWYENIDDVPINQDGIKYYFYPVEPGETKKFRDELALQIVYFYRKLLKAGTSYSDEITASLFAIINEVLNIYFTLILKNKLQKRNYQIVPDQHSRLLKKILYDHSPAYPKILNQLVSGKERLRKRYYFARIIRNFLTQKYIKKNYYKFPNLEKDIISISIDPFLEEHAKYMDKKVYYVRINQWFKNLSIPNGKESDLNFITNSLSEIIIDQFKKNEIDLSDNLKLYFSEFISLLLRKLSIYKYSIINTEIGLPKTLWTPSGGGIFANIFRQVCMSSGSKVVGHAHGSGTGFFSDYGRTLSILEYQSCTDFYVYTKKSVNEYKKYVRKDLIINENLPEIKYIKGKTYWPYDRLRKIDTLLKFKNRENYILYIPSIFIYDNYYDGNLIDAHTTYDWLLKISNFLKENKFNFIIKLHPKKKAPLLFQNYYKNKISKKNLANSIKDAKLIITDQPSSTSFSASIVSNKPIIFIDFSVQKFTDNSWQLINKRCNVLKGFKTKNGLEVDWKILKKFILKPKTIFDQEFKNTYFENEN